MQKKFLLTKSQGQRNIKFVRLTAKIFLILVLLLAVFLFMKPILAANVNTGIEFAAQTGLGTTDLRVTIARIIQAAFGFLGVVAVVLILYGGFIYMTSQGNPEKIEQAKKILRNAIIGLIIMLSAFAITSFILNYLINATGGGTGGGAPAYGSGGGALGNGIIESTYPARGAVDIARNTSIIITFKEKMNVDSLISSDLVNINNVKIHKSSEPNGPYVNARASFTPDLQTFIFKPTDLLGSATEATDYKVELTANINKFDGTAAFGAYGGYDWTFSVSTITDLTPPKIVSVIPRPNNNPDLTVPRNEIVQINFSEPINPLTMSGVVELQDGGTVGSLRRANNVINTFNDIVVCDENLPGDCNDNSSNILAGQFVYSNQYQTVEFITNDLCGKNTCGGNVFCLPGNKFISVLVKAATLATAGSPGAAYPYNGIVDMADNSLDGNLNDVAQGPQSQAGFPPYYLNLAQSKNHGDDSEWSFYTNNTIDLEPPEIVNFYPSAGDVGISPLDSYEVTFSKIMMSSSLKPDSGYGDGYCPCSSGGQCGALACDNVKQYCNNANQQRFVCTPTVPCPGIQGCIEDEFVNFVQPKAADLQAANYPAGGWGYWISSVNDNVQNKTTAIINHDLLGENLNFGVKIGSGVKDIMQNCYQPCAGPQCQKQEETPGVPGKYVPAPDNWKGNFPSCDLSGNNYESKNGFSLTYDNGKVFDFSAFGVDQSLSIFYNYAAASSGIRAYGGVFNNMLKKNRTVSFIYYSINDNKYYLVNIHGDWQSGAGGQLSGSLSGPTNYFSNANFIVRDDYGVTYNCSNPSLSDSYGLCGNNLNYSNSWVAYHTDGEGIYLGDGGQDLTLELRVNSFIPKEGTSNLTPEWYFFAPEGSVPINLSSFPGIVTINYKAS